MNPLLNSALVSWKSTVQSILTAVIGLSAIAPTISMLNPKQAAILVSAGAVAKVVLGVFQQDAGTTLATVPGSATPQVVPSHEIPDNTSAKPVTTSKGDSNGK